MTAPNDHAKGRSPRPVSMAPSSKAGSRIAWTIFFLVSLLIAALMFINRDKRLEFEEEVRLANGEVIVVQRKLTGASLGEIGGPGGWGATYASIESSRFPRWSSEAGLIPVIVDRDESKGQWILVVTSHICDAWWKVGRPNVGRSKLPYLEYRLVDGKWQEALLLSEAVVGRKANLLTNIHFSWEPRRVDLEHQRWRNSQYFFDKSSHAFIGGYSPC